MSGLEDARMGGGDDDGTRAAFKGVESHDRAYASRIGAVMSILNLGVDGWRAFWNNVTAPGAWGVYLLIIAISLLAGFAVHRETGALGLGLRACAALMCAVLVTGVIGVLGVDMNGLTPAVNWLLEQIQAPFYMPVA